MVNSNPVDQLSHQVDDVTTDKLMTTPMINTRAKMTLIGFEPDTL